MNKKYRAGIIGLGNIGFRYTLDPLRKGISSHLEAYKIHPNFEPVSVCDTNIERLNEAKEYCPELKCYTSWCRMLSEEDLDILSICVSPDTNYDVSSWGAASKLKAVIFEKPLCKDVKTGIEIINNINRLNVYAAVNHYRRWHETFLKLKGLIAAGAIGRIQKINGRYATALFNGGVHLIDTIQYILGDFTEIKALDRTMLLDGVNFTYSAYGKIEEVEVFITGFEKSCYNLFEIEIWGDEGKLVVDDFDTSVSVQKSITSDKFLGQKELKEVSRFKTGNVGSNFTNLLDNMVSVLSEGEASRIFCGALDALQAVRVAEGIVISHGSNGAVVNIKKGA